MFFYFFLFFLANAETQDVLKKRVISLLNKADRALSQQQYDKVLKYTDELRAIRLPGTTAYLEEAERMAAQARERLTPPPAPQVDAESTPELSPYQKPPLETGPRNPYQR